jgi:hypothetical protein
MAKTVLQVIESAYRATIEEQDDTVLWLTHALKVAGAELAVLLRGQAVNYATQGQDASGLAFGDWQQRNPPDPGGDLRKLMDNGVAVYLIEEDAAERGIEASGLLAGVRTIARGNLPGLYAQFDRVWHW